MTEEQLVLFPPIDLHTALQMCAIFLSFGTDRQKKDALIYLGILNKFGEPTRAAIRAGLITQETKSS